MSIATLAQGQQLLNLVVQKKISSKRLQQLLEGGFFADLLESSGNLDRDEFRELLNLNNLYCDLEELGGVIIPKIATIFSLKTSGKYEYQSDYAKHYITDENFKVTVTGSRRLCLAHFNKVVNSEYVEKVAEEMGYTVALVEDLLSVGAHSEYRELQRQFPIIALGSSIIVNGYRRVTSLSNWYDKRSLHLSFYISKWSESCRFLLVGKDTPLDA